MNQIQTPPYQQPSFSHPHGIYPQQQPHFTIPNSSASVPAPHNAFPPSQQSPHPLSFSRSQSPLVSPSNQDAHSLATPPPHSLTSPRQQQHQFQQSIPHPQQHTFQQAQPITGNGGKTGIQQASKPDLNSHSGNVTPSRIATFPPTTSSTPAPSLSSQQQQTGTASPQKYSMAAPPLPASVQRQHSPQSGSNPSVSQPSSPHSTSNTALERERVGLLLEINTALLEEMNSLLAQGKGGAVNQQQAALLKSQGLPNKMAADEYVQTFYRLQTNLSYLYSQPDMQALNPQKQAQPQQSNKGPTHPPHFMHPPPHMPSLGDKYGALRKLFPGWSGKDAAVGPTPVV
ncbi:hypothetical protein K461DRAFT_274282 [Myriangium duriaei CBS 260.36]|uniref:Uncharacterized protein n=1 Tax=Myriangium duriaei CBS 260.36 TaxID=1168546 RepID=A0A9P4MT09_9PEZI|nr:hypothetical protein K461DRAFT_274282 [Myriangium duriaei CBS 260.36]